MFYFDKTFKTNTMNTLNESLEKLMKVRQADDTNSSYEFRLFHISLVEKYGSDFKAKLTDDEFNKLYELKERSIQERKERDLNAKKAVVRFRCE